MHTCPGQLEDIAALPVLLQVQQVLLRSPHTLFCLQDLGIPWGCFPTLNKGAGIFPGPLTPPRARDLTPPHSCADSPLLESWSLWDSPL